MFGALEVLRQLKEALWYLREAAHLVPAARCTTSSTP
jgi:hypothetical protein